MTLQEMMKRSFLPIGHGGFCVERFIEGLTVIYDCGTKAPTRVDIANIISKEFSKGSPIDVLFVSHFHQDHINGIERLLKRCQVKRIVLPLISPQDQILCYFAGQLDGTSGGFCQNLLLRPIATIHALSPMTQVEVVASQSQSFQSAFGLNLDSSFADASLLESLGVEPLVEEATLSSTQQNSQMDERASSKDTADIVRVSASGTKLDLNNKAPGWCYIPYNYEYRERRSRLLRRLEQEGLNAIRIRKALATGDKAVISKTRKAYAHATRRPASSCNFHTMTLYSGPENGSNCCQYVSGCEQLSDGSGSSPLRDELIRYRPAGCLHFGDFEANESNGGNGAWDEFINAYKVVWPSAIGCVQMPHHGSRHNWRSELMQPDAVFASQARGVHHPSPTALVELINNHKSVVIATEAQSSRIDFQICL